MNASKGPALKVGLTNPMVPRHPYIVPPDRLPLHCAVYEHPYSILIRQKLSTVSSERGRRDRKPWAPERTVGSKALTYETSPLRECGVAFKAVSHCPRLLD